MEGPGPYAAAVELLLRRPPRIAGGEPLCRPGETPIQAAIRVAPRWHPAAWRSRGRPARARRTSARRCVVELARQGRRVGVTANSHRVIGHLLDSAAARAADRGVAVRIGQKTDRSGDCASDAAEPFDNYGRLLAALEGGEVNVVGGTSLAVVAAGLRRIARCARR